MFSRFWKNADAKHEHGDASGNQIVDGPDSTALSAQFGQSEASISASNITNPYTFTGRRFDPETGLYYYRARYYDSGLGRFLSRDPIGFVGSRWNLYEYVSSDPLGRTDPKGELEVCCRPMRTGGIGDGLIDHCQLRNKCVADETKSPVWPDDKDANRNMDNGKACNTATQADIEACLRRNSHSDLPRGGASGINNNCQSSTVDRLAKCCLNSTWSPQFIANERGLVTNVDIGYQYDAYGGHPTYSYEREYDNQRWKCSKPTPSPDPPTCPPIDDFSHGGWQEPPPDVNYPDGDKKPNIWD